MHNGRSEVEQCVENKFLSWLRSTGLAIYKDNFNRSGYDDVDLLKMLDEGEEKAMFEVLGINLQCAWPWPCGQTSEMFAEAAIRCLPLGLDRVRLSISVCGEGSTTGKDAQSGILTSQ